MSLSTLKQVLFLTPMSTAIWLCMIAASIFWVHAYQLSWVFVPLLALGFLAIHEILAFMILGKGFFPSSERTARVYQWFSLFMGSTGDIKKKGDLTEGFFNGDFTKSIEQATTDKYDEIISRLNLKKGDRVLDVGCGLGDFLFYLKSKGIEGVGLNISPDQQAIGLKRGLDVRVFDFRNELPADLVGQFDAVTMIGCLEHFNECYLMKNRKATAATFEKAFESASKALSPKSKVQRVFSSTLHINTSYRWTLKDFFHAFFSHGHYSGIYPLEGEFEIFCKKHLNVINKYDASIDYQYSSIVCPQHFGHFKIDWNLEKAMSALLLFIVNPFAITSWLYHYCDSWMWQFGGMQIVPESKRPTKTFWYVYEKS